MLSANSEVNAGNMSVCPLDAIKQYFLLSISNFIFFSYMSIIILAQPTFIFHNSKSKDFFFQMRIRHKLSTLSNLALFLPFQVCVISCPKGHAVIIQRDRCNLSAPPTKYLKKQFYPQSNKIPFHHQGWIHPSSD